MKIKNIDLMETFLILRQKIKFGWPEFILALYTLASWITRVYTPEMIKNLHWFLALEVTLGLSIFLTFTFIIFSNIFKIDWYGEKSEKGFLITMVKFFSENISKEKLLHYFFFLDSFLCFIYSRNGNRDLIYTVKRWILLLLSQTTIAFMWLGIGFLINWLSWPLFLSIVILILGIIIIIFRKKIFKESYAQQ